MKLRALALVSFVAMLTACYGMAQTGAGSSQPPTALSVDNQSFADMSIFASRSGQRVRLGIATGNSRTVFTIPSGLVTGMATLRFVADPIGSSRVSVSEEITVSPGDTVVLLIPPS